MAQKALAVPCNALPALMGPFPTLGTQIQIVLCPDHFLVCHVTQMTKKIKKLEKETTMYRSRWESSNKALLEMAEEVSRVHPAARGGGAVTECRAVFCSSG